MGKKLFAHLHTFVLWALASILFWSWIFTFVTDTVPEKKVTVYCLAPGVRDTYLAAALEETMPEGLRMIRVHPFDYVMFGVDAFYQGDLFLLPASEIGNYEELLVPLETGQDTKIYDAAGGTGAAMAYISYGAEDYYLFLGAGSRHLEDGRALAVARALLELP